MANWLCRAAAAALVSLTVIGSAQAQTIRVISSRPDAVTGGDALIEVTAGARLMVNGKDASAGLHADAARGKAWALVSGLKTGANTLSVASGGRTAKLTVINHPISGPVFSGPHQTPFICETETFVLPGGGKLGLAADGDCMVATKVQYLYKANIGGPLKPYDPVTGRPADLAQTITRDGHKVDYFVRLETGVINRAIYQIAFLHQPGTPLPAPGLRSPGWNGGLIYTFGGGCGAAYRQGRGTGGVVNNGEIGNDGLDLGYALASASLNVLGGNCNDVTSAETAMMVKEHFIERFGLPRHTIGVGGSGGSMQQHLLTQNYPGILDGLLPGRSFPDTATMLPTGGDCPLLINYFNASGQNWTDAQKGAVSGFRTFGTCLQAWSNYLPRWVSPIFSGCDAAAAITAQEAAGGTGGRSGAIPKELLYDPKDSPKGARCGYYDNAVNVYGRNSDGSTRRALDNVGVQYGLAAFNRADISGEQFVELNEKIGGFDNDGNFVGARMIADMAALKASYQTGRMDLGSGLASVPIVDVRSYLDNAVPSDVHTKYTTSMTRARLIAANGNADNQIVWTTASKGSLREDTGTQDSPLRKAMRMALVSMDQWLDAIDRDGSALSARQKVLKNKPVGLTDACFTAEMERLNARDTYDGVGRCNEMFPNHADPRIVSGTPVARTALKCQLKPMSATDYKQAITPAQMARLQTVFNGGVCDYRKPGVAEQKPIGNWIRFPQVGVYTVGLQ